MKLELHEKVITKLFDKNKQLLFFDIGACEGLSSVRYLSIFPKSIIFTFEPLPKNFSKVISNKEKYKLDNLKPFQLGLSSTTGNATFYVSSGKPPNKNTPKDKSTEFGNKSSSLFKPGKTKEVHPWLKFKESITIKTDTLTSFCNKENIKSIDFIHMDVQGAELMVLEGAEDMLSNINSIWLEVEKIELYEKQALKNDIEGFLTKNNFICVLNKMNHIAGDQLWVNNTYFDGLDNQTKSSIQKYTKITAIKSSLSSIIGQVKELFKRN